jgi:hypothetical protein
LPFCGQVDKRAAMAKITFSLEEFVEILASNKLLPGQFIRPEVKGQSVHFVIRTNLFVLPYIPATLRYLSFEDNHAIFEISIVRGHLDKAMKRLESLFPHKLPAYTKLEYPKIFVNVVHLLKEKNIRGIRVNDISFEQGRFTIETCNI